MQTLALAALAALAAPSGDSPIEELRARRVVAADAADWTAEQAQTLRRLRRAEALGALSYLRDKTGTLSGAAVELPTAKGFKRLVLTVPGYERWLFVLSQEARAYFESKGAESKFVFQVTTTDKKRLFDDLGMLTDDGVDLYLAAKRKEKVFWIGTDGRVTGTVRPPASGLAAPTASEAALGRGHRPSPPPALPPPPKPAAAKPPPGEMPAQGPVAPPPGRAGPADRAAAGVIDGLVRAGAVEIDEDEAKFLAETSGLSQAELLEKTSLQAVPAGGKMRFFLHPTDPLTKKLGEYRRAKGR